jgi:hypothetical protein
MVALAKRMAAWRQRQPAGESWWRRQNGGGIRRRRLAGGSEKAWRNGSVKKNISQWRKLISMKRNNQRK